MEKVNDSSQNLLDISGIKDGIVIMKNGSIRAILMASSINFFLKSPEEQDALIFGYQSFLNSLDFPLQIVVNSRKLKIDSYIETLKKIEKNQTNDLLKTQTAEYADFVKELVKMSNIMSKTFYVTIPFSMVETKQGGTAQKIFSILRPGKSTSGSTKSFEQAKGQLMQRVEMISGALNSLGIKNAMLNTQEVIELFYNLYNPDISGKNNIAELSNLSMDTNDVQ